MKNILLLHGAIGAKDQLLPLAEKLGNNFIVHTLNFSGHGGELMPDNFSIEIFAEDVLNYLDEKKIEKISIFGYSMGGYVALYLAKHHPEKIEKIFTLATKFLWTPEISAKEIKMLDAEKMELKVPAFAKILEQRHYPNDWKLLLKKTAEMMISLGENNTLKLTDFDTITHPVCIGIGDDDVMVTIGETKAVYERLKNGNLVILDETEHPIEKVDLLKLMLEMNSFF